MDWPNAGPDKEYIQLETTESSDVTFSLNVKEKEARDAWFTEPDVARALTNPRASVHYIFCPTGIGVNCTIKIKQPGKKNLKRDVTDYDSW